MSSYYDTYINRINETGSTPTQYYKTYLQNIIDQRFTMASDYFTIQYESATPTVYTDIGVRLTFPYSMNAMSTVKDDWRRIIFQNNDSTIKLGKKYKFNNFSWLTVDTGTMESLTSSCIVRRCNNSLKWIDNGVIKEEVCIIDEKNNNMLNENNNSIIIPDGTMYVTIQKNSNTNKIKENQRFILNDYAFKVSFVSKFNNVDNLIKLTMQKQQIDISNDNLELGIADYYNNVYTLKINQSSFEQRVGYTGQLTSTLTFNDKYLDSEVEWISSDNDLISIDENGNFELLAVENIDSYINYNNNIVAYDDNNNNGNALLITDDGGETIEAIVQDGTPLNPLEVKLIDNDISVVIPDNYIPYIDVDITCRMVDNYNVSDTITITVVLETVENKINVLSPQIYEVLSGEYNEVTYTINSYNNGIITTDTFNVSASGLSNSAYELSIIDGNSFKIKSNGYQSDKLHITCTDQDDNTTLEFDIQLKNLW